MNGKLTALEVCWPLGCQNWGFYGTGIEIWAGFGPIGSTEKKGSGPIMSNFCERFFHVFRGKKNIKFCFKTL